MSIITAFLLLPLFMCAFCACVLVCTVFVQQWTLELNTDIKSHERTSPNRKSHLQWFHLFPLDGSLDINQMQFGIGIDEIVVRPCLLNLSEFLIRDVLVGIAAYCQ